MNPHADQTPLLPSLDPRAAWLLWETLDSLCARLWDIYYLEFLDYCENQPPSCPHMPQQSAP